MNNFQPLTFFNAKRLDKIFWRYNFEHRNNQGIRFQTEQTQPQIKKKTSQLN